MKRKEKEKTRKSVQLICIFPYNIFNDSHQMKKKKDKKKIYEKIVVILPNKLRKIKRKKKKD